MDLTLKHCSADMYANDTTFYVSGKSTHDLNIKLQEDMVRINEWCVLNKMVINTDKTKTLLIGSSQRLASLPDNANDLTVSLQGITLQAVDHDKLLGVMIDNKLSWHAQIDHVYKSVSRLALLRRISPYIDVGTRIL